MCVLFCACQIIKDESYSCYTNVWLSLHHEDLSQHTGVDPDLYYILAIAITNNMHANEPRPWSFLNLMDSVKWSSWGEHLPVVVEQPVPSVPSVSFCMLHSFDASYRHIHESMLCIMLITLCLLLLHFIDSSPPNPTYTHPQPCIHTHTYQKQREIYDGILVLGTAKPTRINQRTVTILNNFLEIRLSFIYISWSKLPI